MLIGASACDCAAHGRIGRCRNVITIKFKVCFEDQAIDHLELDGGNGIKCVAIQQPVEEGVAFVCRCHQRAGITIVVSTRAGDGAACFGNCRGSDKITVELEVGHIHAAVDHGELIGRIG